jgi:hypothetical protein
MEYVYTPPPPRIDQYIYPPRPIYRWGIYCGILGVTCMRGGGENSGGGDAMEGSGLDGILRHARTLSTRDADEYLSQVLHLSTESLYIYIYIYIYTYIYIYIYIYIYTYIYIKKYIYIDR